MAVKSRSRSRQRAFVQKPSGNILARVQAVGPEHFGVVCVDPHKGSSVWMLADFYGKILIEPQPVGHAQGQLETVIGQLRRTIADRGLKDCLIAVERTGQYHLPVRRAFQAAGWEVRIVHPFATKQFRLAADPGNKTDETDLAAMHRAVVNGFGLAEERLESPYPALRLLVRARRDLVEKSSKLRCQIREHLGAVLPGFDQACADLFDSDVPLTVARGVGSAAALCQLGVSGMAALLRQANVRFQTRSLEKILVWAKDAAPAESEIELRRQIWTALDDDRREKARKIQQIEGQTAAALVQTPYVLLLAIPGFNVVSAADLAGELGPIAGYAGPNNITGRAGLCPARHQSGSTDRADGPIRRQANKRLRAALLRAADNLIACNDHFRLKALAWTARGKDARAVRIRVAKTLSRLAYVIVAGRQLVRHPALQTRAYILHKLLAFHREHDIGMSLSLRDLLAAVDQVPKTDHPVEAKPLADELTKILAGRRRGPVLVGDILPAVLAKLGVAGVQSGTSEVQAPQ